MILRLADRNMNSANLRKISQITDSPMLFLRQLLFIFLGNQLMKALML